MRSDKKLSFLKRRKHFPTFSQRSLKSFDHFHDFQSFSIYSSVTHSGRYDIRLQKFLHLPGNFSGFMLL